MAENRHFRAGDRLPGCLVDDARLEAALVRQSGAEAAAIVWGTCTDCKPSLSSFEISLSISDVLDELLGGLGKPVLAGLVFGHTKERATIPLGVEAELDATAKTFTILEAGVRA